MDWKHIFAAHMRTRTKQHRNISLFLIDARQINLFNILQVFVVSVSLQYVPCTRTRVCHIHIDARQFNLNDDEHVNVRTD